MTQTEAILDLLRERGPLGITPLEALEEARCFRLAARIKDLREQGHDIRTYTIPTKGAHHARYVLVEPKADTGDQLSWTARMVIPPRGGEVL